jgi:hypothetical protein
MTFPQTVARLLAIIVSSLNTFMHQIHHVLFIHSQSPFQPRTWSFLFHVLIYEPVLPHQQLPHDECGGCRITSASWSPGLGPPRRPGNMAQSTAISILFITRSRSISTAWDTFCPVAALVSKYNKLFRDKTVNVYMIHFRRLATRISYSFLKVLPIISSHPEAYITCLFS